MEEVSYAARTDVGKKRQHNEDCYGVNETLGLYVIADGMGGHASGEVASKIAVSVVEEKVTQGLTLVDAIEQAHLAILEGVENGEGKKGMGTTIVAVQLHENEYALAWVGDSRAYLWDGNISQLTKDHSMVQMLIDSGQITEAEARVHPGKNIIFQNLGSEQTEVFHVSVEQGVLYSGQKIVLCSDGLSDEVDDDEMNEIINACHKVADNDGCIVDELVNAALKNGGSDNISVMVVSASIDAMQKPE